MPTNLPFPTSNNAPLPIPGGYGNPTGANFGIGSGGGGTPFPAMPAYGNPVYNMGAYGTGAGLAGLSSGFSTNDPGRTQNLYNYLGKAYGKGPGQLLGNMLTQGLFNPQVAAAFLNAQQPGIERGMAGIQSSFGDAGARFSSAAALGLGDYQSQVQLNQQQTLASLFENAQSQELSLLQSVLPTIHQERADEGGWLNKVLGGIESVGGLIAAPFTGGASLALTGAGLGSLMGHGSSGGQMAGLGSLASLFGGNQSAFPNMSPGAISGSYGGPTQVPLIPSSFSLPSIMQSDAGNLWGENLGLPADSWDSGGILGGGIYGANGELIGMH